MSAKKLKVLVVDFKRIFPSKTNEALYASLELIADVTYYGPGYISTDSIEESLQKVCGLLGPFDACFINSKVINYLHPDTDKHLFECNDRITTYLFNTKRFSKLKPRFAFDYEKLSCPLFLVSMLQDNYAFPDWYFRYYGEFPGYLLLPPKQSSTSISETPDICEESFGHWCNDDYTRFCKQHEHKMIPIAHLIFDNEVLPIKDSQNKCVAVPGVLYAKRKNVLRALKRKGIPARNKLFKHKIVQIMAKTRLVNYNYPFIRDIYRDLFVELITNSLVSYTDGSRLRMFIKKYLEIPACGSLLMCDPFKNANAFGFVEGQHYIQADEFNICDKVDYYFNNEDKALQIIHNSQEMLRRCHTATALAPTFAKMIQLSIENNLYGGFWREGKLWLARERESEKSSHSIKCEMT